MHSTGAAQGRLSVLVTRSALQHVRSTWPTWRIHNDYSHHRDETSTSLAVQITIPGTAVLISSGEGERSRVD